MVTENESPLVRKEVWPDYLGDQQAARRFIDWAFMQPQASGKGVLLIAFRARLEGRSLQEGLADYFLGTTAQVESVKEDNPSKGGQVPSI